MEDLSFIPTPLAEILARRFPQARRREPWRGGSPGEPKPLWAILGEEPPTGWGLAGGATTVPLAQATPSEEKTAVTGGRDQRPTGPAAGADQQHQAESPPRSGVLYSDDFLPGGKLFWPTDYPVVTERFGVSNPNVRAGSHNGVDARAYRGSPIYAVDDGVVIDVYHHPRGGNQIRIRHPDGYVSGYAHTGPVVQPGQSVRRGEVIGHSDGSGTPTPHLHFTYRPGPDAAPVDPYPYLPQVPVKE